MHGAQLAAASRQPRGPDIPRCSPWSLSEAVVPVLGSAVQPAPPSSFRLDKTAEGRLAAADEAGAWEADKRTGQGALISLVRCQARRGVGPSEHRPWAGWSVGPGSRGRLWRLGVRLWGGGYTAVTAAPSGGRLGYAQCTPGRTGALTASGSLWVRPGPAEPRGCFPAPTPSAASMRETGPGFCGASGKAPCSHPRVCPVHTGHAAGLHRGCIGACAVPRRGQMQQPRAPVSPFPAGGSRWAPRMQGGSPQG